MRAYLHRLADVPPAARDRYVHFSCAIESPIAQIDRRQLCFGVWDVVAATGHDRRVLSLWEYQSWEDLAHGVEQTVIDQPPPDARLAPWFDAAPALSQGTASRVLVSPDWSPGIEQLCQVGARGAGYAHEEVRCRQGAAREVLEAVRETGVGAYADAGLGLIGAFRQAMVDDDVLVLIWAFGDYAGWGDFEEAALDTRSPVGEWRSRIAADVVGWERTLLADAPLSPLRTGRQPDVGDRKALDDV